MLCEHTRRRTADILMATGFYQLSLQPADRGPMSPQ